MIDSSGPSENELHARLNAFLQTDAAAETADEDTIRNEVQQLTGGLPARAPDERVHSDGQHSISQRRRNTTRQARWGSLWSILEALLLVTAGFSLAVSLVTPRGSTPVSVVASAVATVAVLALVYVRTAARGSTASRTREDRDYENLMRIRQWEREDRLQAMLWERQDKLRELAHAREDFLRHEQWKHAHELREEEFYRAEIIAEKKRREEERANEREDHFRRERWARADAIIERKRDKELRAEAHAHELAVMNQRLDTLKQITDRGLLDAVNVEDLLSSLTTPLAVSAASSAKHPAELGPTTIVPASEDVTGGRGPRPQRGSGAVKCETASNGRSMAAVRSAHAEGPDETVDVAAEGRPIAVVFEEDDDLEVPDFLK